MVEPTPHDRERQSHAQYAEQHSDPQYQVRERPLHEAWRRFNREYFGARLKPPHIGFGRTAHRSLAHCVAATGYGGKLEMTLNPGLVFGTNREWVLNGWPAATLASPPAQGTWRVIEDLLLRLTVRQHVIEV